ncbi:hypothetical protein NQZ68_007716 [Dissostichus eleginoides]|nr:hypothetical protein NQZ68_007716 [Dissostichus eleginoides]
MSPPLPSPNNNHGGALEKRTAPLALWQQQRPVVVLGSSQTRGLEAQEDHSVVKSNSRERVKEEAKEPTRRERIKTDPSLSFVQLAAKWQANDESPLGMTPAKYSLCCLMGKGIMNDVGQALRPPPWHQNQPPSITI